MLSNLVAPRVWWSFRKQHWDALLWEGYWAGMGAMAAEKELLSGCLVPRVAPWGDLLPLTVVVSGALFWGPRVVQEMGGLGLKPNESRPLLQFSSNSHSVVSHSLRPHGLQHARLPYPSPMPGAYSNSCPSAVTPSNHLILCCPLLLLPSIFPSINQGLFQWVSSSYQVAKVLEFQFQHQSFQQILKTDFL